MTDLENTKLHSYLKEVFAADSQGYVRLIYFADQADAERRADIASVLRSLADRQLEGALGHLRFLSEAGDPITDMPITNLSESIDSAVDGFNYDCSGNFQWMIQMAQDEKLDQVATWLSEVLQQKSETLGELREMAGNH